MTAEARTATAAVVVAMTTEGRSPRRLAVGSLGILVMLVAVAWLSSCSTGPAVDAGQAVAPLPTVAVAPPTSAEAATPPVEVVAELTPAPTSSVVAAAPLPNAQAMLAQALDGLGGGFHFATTITVGGAPAASAEGDRIGDGTRLVLDVGGGLVAYIVTAEGAWAMPDGGEWAALDVPPAAADPLAALRAPASITVEAFDGAATRLAAVVPAQALGVSTDPTAMANVTIELEQTTLRAVTYETQMSGQVATVRSTFAPPADPNPVTAPV